MLPSKQSPNDYGGPVTARQLFYLSTFSHDIRFGVCKDMKCMKRNSLNGNKLVQRILAQGLPSFDKEFYFFIIRGNMVMDGNVYIDSGGILE